MERFWSGRANLEAIAAFLQGSLSWRPVRRSAAHSRWGDMLTQLFRVRPMLLGTCKNLGLSADHASKERDLTRGEPAGSRMWFASSAREVVASLNALEMLWSDAVECAQPFVYYTFANAA